LEQLVQLGKTPTRQTLILDLTPLRFDKVQLRAARGQVEKDDPSLLQHHEIALDHTALMHPVVA